MTFRPSGIVAGALAGVLAVGLAAAGPSDAAPRTPAAVKYTPGASGIGDPYFPLLGNGGFDVRHYGLFMNYTPRTKKLVATALVYARATQNLSRFDLDYSGPKISSVRVNDRAARFSRPGPELRITPKQGLRKGSDFVVRVRYAGTPKTIKGSPIVFGSDYGWQYTKDGSFVGDEPNGARTWFPSSDHPSDKATFSFHVTVPKGKQVVANGDRVATTRRAASTTFVWRETKPMATYLATVDIGNWNYRTGRTPGGIRQLQATDPTHREAVARIFRQTGRITDFWAKTFGRYPFTSTGAIVDDVPDVGFSLETQTRPLYGFAADQGTIAHELAHQWFGDSVSVRTWRDIWLNEGFATFAAAYWSEHIGGANTYDHFKAEWQQVPASSSFWKQSIRDPKRDTMFSAAVYERGGMTLAALRKKIGDADFFRLLRTWTSQHRYGNATTSQFTALAEKVSGRQLDAFFRTWLVTQSKPATF
ncbi:M1 family metallopeptidase [Jatrophihabitans fulvus]